MMVSTGMTVPSTFDMWVTPTSLGRSSRSAGRAVKSSSPPSVTGMNSKRSPRSAANICHGTRLEWCSISLNRMTSPLRRLARARDGLGRFLRQTVHSAVDVGVVQLVERLHRLQHDPRLLGGRRRIQVDQRNPRPQLAPQPREIGPPPLGAEDPPPG